METGTVTEPAPAPVDPPTEVQPPVGATPTDAAPTEVTPTEVAPTEVAPAALENISLPAIEGDPVVGGALSSTGGQWSGAGWIQYTWIIDGVVIQTAAHSIGEADVLQIAPSMVGKSVQLKVVASPEPQAAGTEVSALPVTVRPTAFTGLAWSNLVTGKPAVGQALSLSAPQWDNSASQGTVTYQWFRGTLAIASATASRYTVTAADVGQKL